MTRKIPSWDENLRESAKDFLNVVWPKIKEWFGSGDLIPVEAITDSEMAILFDQKSGIDAWYIEDENGIRGIASRVQWGWKDWRTFTVRMKTIFGGRTEYQKLTNAIENDWLYPHWTCQAYLTKNKHLLNVGRCKTKDLIEYMQDNKELLERQTRIVNKGRPNPFCYISWDELSMKYPVDILNESHHKRHTHSKLELLEKEKLWRKNWGANGKFTKPIIPPRRISLENEINP